MVAKGRPVESWVQMCRAAGEPGSSKVQNMAPDCPVKWVEEPKTGVRGGEWAFGALVAGLFCAIAFVVANRLMRPKMVDCRDFGAKIGQKWAKRPVLWNPWVFEE